MTSSAWHGGKGSGSRPKSVSNEDYANRWDAIFNRDKKEDPPKEDSKDTQQENSLERHNNVL